MTIKHLCEEDSRRKRKYTPPIKIGERIDFLTLIDYIPLEGGRGHRRGLFRCDCGKEITRILTQMIKPVENPKSCGCQIDFSSMHKRKSRKKGFDGELASKFYLGRL